MKLLHPRAVVDTHVEHPPLDLERPSSRCNFLPNDLRPDREDLLLFQSLIKSDGFEYGGKDVTDPRESFMAHV